MSRNDISIVFVAEVGHMECYCTRRSTTCFGFIVSFGMIGEVGIAVLTLFFNCPMPFVITGLARRDFFQGRNLLRRLVMLELSNLRESWRAIE